MRCLFMSPETKTLLNLRRLRYIKRCNNFPVNLPENVAAHSFFVVQMTMIIADELNSAAPQSVDVEKAMRKAVLHDTMEAFTGDIPWNVKHHSDEVHKAIAKAENDLSWQLVANGNTFISYMDTLKQCKEGLEGAIVNLADMLELALFCYEEIQSGSIFMVDMLRKCIDLCKGFIQECDALENSSTVLNLMETLKEACRSAGSGSPLDID